MSIANIITRLPRGLTSALSTRSLATKVTATTTSAVDALPAAAVAEAAPASSNAGPFAAAEPSRKPIVPRDYRLMYPEFLPDPKIEWRNPIREKLERLDMLQRRYVDGGILVRRT